jgi:hypothetical protein
MPATMFAAPVVASEIAVFHAPTITAHANRASNNPASVKYYEIVKPGSSKQ